MAKAKSFKIAVLDEKDNRLTGYKTKAKPTKDDVVVDDNCDLPVDGTYYWLADESAFFPVGRGLGKPKRPPIPEHKVQYLIAKTLIDDMPQEVKDWVEWYEQQIIPRSAG